MASGWLNWGSGNISASCFVLSFSNLTDGSFSDGKIKGGGLFGDVVTDCEKFFDGIEPGDPKKGNPSLLMISC